MNRNQAAAISLLQLLLELGDRGMWLLTKYRGELHKLVKELDEREKAETFVEPLSDDEAIRLIRLQGKAGDSTIAFVNNRRSQALGVGSGPTVYRTRKDFTLQRVADEHPLVTPEARECIKSNLFRLVDDQPTSDSVVFWHPGQAYRSEKLDAEACRKMGFLFVYPAHRPSAALLAGLLLTRQMTVGYPRHLRTGEWLETNTHDATDTMCMRMNKDGLLEVTMLNLVGDEKRFPKPLITPVVVVPITRTT